jgi:phosphoribosyl-ATP pyrophosphohydrolase/phosphoribosyl-AMP cyclohydrolase
VTPDRIATLAWDRSDGLIPAIVQHARTGKVLMLAYMNREALRLTLKTGRVTFFSRSRAALWTKGETSGNYLRVVDVTADCDSDTILVRADPLGPTCHTGTESCFPDAPRADFEVASFLAVLEATIAHRSAEKPQGSYTARLLAEGHARVAQKVGEEGVETALAAVTQDDAGLLCEAADLLYHLMVLLKARNLGLRDLVAELRSRHGGRA